MKVQYILRTLLFFLLGLTSCVDEQFEGNGGLPGTINLVLTTPAVQSSSQTKGTVAPSSDELKIQECAVAIFRNDGQNGYEKVGFAYQNFEGVSTDEGKPTYRFDNVTVKTGKVKILVLANYNKKTVSELDALSYEAFRALRDENVQAAYNAVFQADHLIKFGEKDADITTASDRTLHVDLAQLAARVDLAFEVDVPEATVEETTEWKFSIEDLTDIVKKKNPGHWAPGMEYGECKGSNLPDGLGHANHDQSKYLYVHDNVKTTTKTKTAWVYQIEKLSVGNVNLSSDVFLNEYEKGKAYTYNLLSETTDLQIDVSNKQAVVSFYTYEKANTETPISIQVEGQLIFGDSIIKTVEHFAMEYQWNSNGWGREGEFLKETQLMVGTTHSTTTFDNIQSKATKKYQLELLPIEGATSHTNGLVHGNVYEVTGKINVNDMSVKFEVAQKPWVVQSIDAVINDVHYLFVSENEAKMPNVSTYNIGYASDLSIQIKNVKATYTRYYQNRSKEMVSELAEYGSNTTQYPAVKIEGTNITINSKLPANFFPKIITFDVIANDNISGNTLTEHVKVIQYPALYMEGEVSKGGDATYLYTTGSGYPKQNPNLFTITTIAADKYKVGISKQSDGTTAADAVSNELVSPRFIVASRYALVATSKWTRSDAIERCKKYWETTNSETNMKTGEGATYGVGKWRLPTIKELELMYNMQKDSETIGVLFNNDGKYWSAKKTWYFDFAKGTPVKHAEGDDKIISGGGGIRCVYDLY